MGKKNLRSDIQMLRGYAILLMVFYHAEVPYLGAGYLGVDIFFVISGFLITSLILKKVRAGTFSFSEFYLRRAKRLLPAAYVTFSVTALFSFLLLTKYELKMFLDQLVGAVTFTGNIVLFDQTNYFDRSAEMKPLLHVWSLSIEEQYYIVIPLALAMLAKRTLVPLVIAIVGVSLFLSLNVTFSPEATFFLLPTRAWELGVGTLGAFLVIWPTQKPSQYTMIRWLFWPSALSLIVVPFLPGAGTPPGINALIVCLGAIFFILYGKVFSQENGIVKGMCVVGDMSYSLYLVHWPIFALLNSIYFGGGVPFELRLMALVLSFVLGYLLYRTIENPFRYTSIRYPRRWVGGAVAASCALVITPIVVADVQQRGQKNYAEIMRPNGGFDKCGFSGNYFPKSECQNKNDPKILVWGDSFAMHLVTAIAANTQAGVAQATLGNCGPFLGMSIKPLIAKQCIEFNQSVLDYLKSDASVDTVVLASVFRPY